MYYDDDDFPLIWADFQDVSPNMNEHVFVVAEFTHVWRKVEHHFLFGYEERVIYTGLYTLLTLLLQKKIHRRIYKECLSHLSSLTFYLALFIYLFSICILLTIRNEKRS